MKYIKTYGYADGKVFTPAVGEFVKTTKESELINVYPLEKSEIMGFGGAFTYSSAKNYFSADDKDKKNILEYLFGNSGLKYNFCRLCIGSSDFSDEEYCYVSDDDPDLSSFTIDRDRAYIIPFIKDAIAYSAEEIKFFASPWSPPAFMKTNNTRFNGGTLKKEYYSLYARYIAKFIKAYEKEGIKIYAVTLQNEPKASQTWESCCFSPSEEAEFAKVLKGVFDEESIGAKIICWDHNKERLFERADEIYNKCGDIVSGSGFHWYSGEHYGAIDAVKTKYPDKILLATEFCLSIGIDEVDSSYAREIIGDISCGANAMTEWNLILDEQGGPYHNRKAGCDAPIKFFSDKNEVSRSGIYYETYAFSHFINRGAKTLYTSSFNESIKTCAVKNPNGEIVLCVFNSSAAKKAKIYVEGFMSDVELKEKGLYTFVIG